MGLENDPRFTPELLLETLRKVYREEKGRVLFTNGNEILFDKIARGEPLQIEQRYHSFPPPIRFAWDFGVDQGVCLAVRQEPDGRITILDEWKMECDPKREVYTMTGTVKVTGRTPEAQAAAPFVQELLNQAALEHGEWLREGIAEMMEPLKLDYAGFENFDGTLYTTTNHAKPGQELTLESLEQALQHWREFMAVAPPDLTDAEAREMSRLRWWDRTSLPELRQHFVGIPMEETTRHPITSGTYEMGGTTFHWVRYLRRDYWPVGEWDTEEWDKVVWRHRGLWCMVRRGDFGAWEGYVLLEPGDPARRTDADRPLVLEFDGAAVEYYWPSSWDGSHIGCNTLPARQRDPADMFAHAQYSEDNRRFYPLCDDAGSSGGWSTYIPLSAALRLTERLAVALHPWFNDGKENGDETRQ